MANVSPRSSPLRDVSQRGTSVTQWQKFHTDDVNQCLNNKFSSHGVPNANLFNFTFLLVDFGKVLCSSANELHTSPFLGTVELKIALRAQNVSGAFKKRAPGLTKNVFGPLGRSFMLILGTLSKDIFERHMSTGSEAFSLSICLDANKLVLLSLFSLLKTIYPRVSTKPLPNHAKTPLPVDVRRSKTLLLKLPIDQGKSPALEVTAINSYYTKNLFIEYTDSQVNTSLLLCPGISLFFISIISNFWNVEPIIFRYIS